MFLDTCEIQQIKQLIDALNDNLDDNCGDGKSLLTFEVQVVDSNGDAAGIVKFGPNSNHSPFYAFYPG